MKNNDISRQAVILGALLHDIGKFAQRAQENPKEQKHTFWGGEWFEKNLSEKLTSVFGKNKEKIESAIRNHHDYEVYITLADALSAGMERISLENEEEGDPFSDRLVSILSRVSISDGPKDDWYYKLNKLGKDKLQESFPIKEKKCTFQEYHNLWVEFNEELKGLSFLNPQQTIEQMFFLLWKYTWCIPSAAYKVEPDVSLFDHLKTTSAIAVCLYDYHQENSIIEINSTAPAFCLIGGDISGIQSYIFEVLSQQGKVARRLRARSLFVQLISEVSAHKILHAFDLPLCNLIISAGGNFYILAPNLKRVKERLDKLQKEFDNWTLRELQGELSINLSSIEVSGEKLRNFSEILEELKAKINRKKYQPYNSLFLSKGKWDTSEFLRREVIEGDEKACKGCHKNPIVKEEFCQHCLIDKEIGGRLPWAKYIAFYKENNRKFRILDYSFELWDNYCEDKDAYSVLALNDTEQDEKRFKYIANYIPFNQEGPKSFSEIAKDAQGDKLLGYLKADVDNLGKILRSGIKNPSISRMTTFSRMLEVFFAGYLQTRLKKDYPDLYTVFSGGDDFFIVGPWNRVIDFAKEIRSQFSKFCGDNPDLTFSAGIILAKDHEPISLCTESAEKELKESKTGEKDSITLFNHTLKWSELTKNILPEAQQLIKWLKTEPPKVSRAFIYNLRQYGNMYQQYEKTRETRYLKFVPLLNYDIYRNLTKKEQQEVKDWALKLSPTIIKDKFEDTLPYLRVITEYVLTYTRGGKDAEKM